MESFEEDMKTLTTPGEKQQLPGAVLLAATTTDDLVYKQCFGTTSLEPEKSRSLTEKSIFWIASCTKLLTSIAALQLVEAGKVSLDTEVDTICTELQDGPASEVLDGWNDDGSPKLRKATKKILLRHLLTHTSGLAYDFLSEEVMKWFLHRKISPMDVMGDVKEAYNTPLLFEPGTKWMYSPGLDWAGILISRVSGEEDLQAYMRKHIWGLLGIKGKDMAFRQNDLGLTEQETTERIVHLTLRKQGDGSIVPAQPIRSRNSKDCLGGGGLLASPDAYLKVLTSLLRNDGKILRKETVEKYMLEPQLVEGKVGASAYDSLIEVCNTMLGARMLTGGLPLPKEDGAHEYQHALLGLLDRPKGTKDWTLSWGGLPNLFWHVSPSTGVCGIYASQIIPPGDPKSMEMAVRWREELRKRFGKRGGKSNL